MGLKISILNSRQAINPSLADQWIINTIQAVKFILKNDYSLISSVGMSSWEIVTTLGSLLNIPMTIYLPIKKNESITRTIETVKNDFELEDKIIEYIPLVDFTNDTYIRLNRDAEILANSNKIIPVSVRTDGNLYKRIQSLPQGRIIDDFRCKYYLKDNKNAYTIARENINQEITTLQDDYFIHWTKSTFSKRENEKLIDFYSDLLKSYSYPRSAYLNLQNIVSKKIIYASSKDIPSKTKVVSFSATEPVEMYKLFRWRSRHRQMSFEPYGIAIEKNIIKDSIFPVQYYNEKTELDKSIPPWQTHSKGTITDWSFEREYRYKSDFKFNDIDVNKIILITRFKKEADELKKLTGIKTISYTNS